MDHIFSNSEPKSTFPHLSCFCWVFILSAAREMVNIYIIYIWLLHPPLRLASLPRKAPSLPKGSSIVTFLIKKVWISVGFTTGIPNSSSPVGVRTFLFKFIFIAGQWYSFRIRVETWGPSSIFSFLTHNHQFSSFPSDKTPPHLQLFPSRLSLCFPKESLCSKTPD